MSSATTDRRLGLAGNTAYKTPAQLATTANITLSGEQAIDGTLTAASRVLVKNQTDTTTNGLYDTSSAAWTRCIDANGNYDLVQGTQVLVAAGSANAQTVWVITSATPTSIGTSAITFAQSLSANVLTALAASGGSALIGFLQSGAGAIARTVQSKLREMVSVTDFGAVADGNYATGTGTDNSAAFQAAINALSSTGGGVVYIPGGPLGTANASYKLSSQITVPDGVSIVGAGKWSSILFCPTAFANTGGLIRINGSTGNPTVVTGIGVVAQTGGSGGAGIVSVKNGTFISDVWANGFTSNHGIRLSNTDNFLADFAIELCQVGLNITECNLNVEHGTLFGCTQGAVIGNSASAEAGRATLTAVRAIQCTTDGFAVSSGKQVSLIGCSAAHVNNGMFGDAGVLVDTSTDVLIDGFVGKIGGTASTTGVGIKLVNGSTDVVISNPQVSGWLDGISSNGCSVNITGGESKANGRNGVLLLGGARVKCTGIDSFGNALAGAGSGIDSRNSATFSMHSLVGNTCTQTGGGNQQYGIFADVTDNGASTGNTSIVGNICRFNLTAEISNTGKVANISMAGNVPEGAVGSGTLVVTTAATYAFSYAEKVLVCNGTATCTITLPAAASNIGRRIRVQTIVAFTVVSASANVVPLAGGAAGTAVLAATAGKFADLETDGTNWRIVGAN